MLNTHLSTKWIVVALCSSAVPAMAYIDPGIGGFIWQGLVAVSVGVVFHVLRWVGILSKDKTDTEPETLTSQNENETEIHGSDHSKNKQRA